MKRALCLLLMLCSPVMAQDLTTDAFGIVPTDHLGDREHWAGLRVTSDNEQIEIGAGGATTTLLFVGPKSIVAGIEPGHAVALGLDRNGNLVSDVSTEVALGYGPRVQTTADFGLASVLFTPPPQAGSFWAGAELGGIQSARANYRVTAHLATVLPQFQQDNAGRIDPETVTEIATAPLVDAYGNQVDDGVGVGILLAGDTSATTFLTTVVRDGTAQARLLTRYLDGRQTGRLTLGGTTAVGLTLDIEKLDVMDDVDVFVWPIPDLDAVRLRVGPLAMTQGFVVPDGVAAEITVMSADGASRQAQSWVLDGHLSVDLALSPSAGPFDVTLIIAGTQINRSVAPTAPLRDQSITGAQ